MKYTDEELLDEIREANTEVEGPPTGPYFDQREGPGTSTVTNRFGKWTTAKRKAGVDNVGVNGKLPVNRDYFSSIDTPEKAYWLGVLYGDGCINTSNTTDGVFLGLKEREHVAKFKSALDAEHAILERKNGVYVIEIRDQQLVDDLAGYGLDSDKTFSNALPNLVEESHRAAFTRGLFDADGTFGNTIWFRVSGSNIERFEKLIEWFPSDGIVRDYQDCAPVLEVRKKDGVYDLWNWLYPDGSATAPALERKLKKIPK